MCIPEIYRFLYEETKNCKFEYLKLYKEDRGIPINLNRVAQEKPELIEIRDTQNFMHIGEYIDNDIKIWGFWNELGEEMAAQNAEHNVTGRANTVKASDENLKPWYYTWSMLCRYFPSGTKILETTDSYVDQLRVTSGIIPVADDKGDISIAVVNNSSSQKTLEVNMPKCS